ncbi:MAG: hypothetical protein AAFR53_03225 [Pseudomonadota bacterium]
MSASLETFFAAWGESDAATRAGMIAGSLAEGATYSDPRSGGRLSGAAIADYVGQFSANAPGWTAEVANVSEVNGYLRAKVAFGGKGPDGTDMVQHGIYFADTDDEGRLTLIAGFVGAEA